MAAKKAARYVTVAGTTYAPGDEIPADVAKLIDNPRAFEEDAAGDGPPPMAGKGSGAKAWADYAAANDVEVADDATRDDIVQALVDAGVPVE